MEGYVLIPEGEQRGYFEDHYAMELAVTIPTGSGAEEVFAFSGGFMKVGKDLPLEGASGTITIEELHENCTVAQRSGEAPPGTRGLPATTAPATSAPAAAVEAL